MANVRILQLGQTAVNRPFFEVVINARCYVVALNERGLIEFKKPRFLRDLGVYTGVSSRYEQTASSDLINALRMSNDLLTAFDYRFKTINYGSDLAFNPEFKPYAGWAVLSPANPFVFSF